MAVLKPYITLFITSILISPCHLLSAAHQAEPELITLFTSLSQNKKNTELLRAAQNGDTDKVRLLLLCKADINIKNNKSKGGTPLHLATCQGHIETVKLLISNHADINSKNNEECLPIHAAIANSHKAIVSLLLREGAYINAQDKQGISPFHRAIKNSNYKIMQLLVQKKADIHACTAYKAQPLHWAAIHNNQEATRFLLEHNISTTIVDKQLDTPIHWAAEKGHPDVLQLLLADECIKQQPSLEHERMTLITSSLSYLPSVLIPLILEYKGLETEQAHIVTDFIPPSLILKNQSEKTALMCAQHKQAKQKDLTKREEIEKCINLLKSQYANIMRSAIARAIQK